MWNFLFFLMVLTMGLTMWIRQRALQKNMMDVPNERSSHVIPTARGGGLAFVLCFGASLICARCFVSVEVHFLWALWIISVGIAGVGWLDDQYTVPIWARLLIQIVSVVSACMLLPWEQLAWVGPGVVVFIGLGMVLVLGLVNVFNFLDGIDGYAVMESAFVASVLAVMSGVDGFESVRFVLGSLVAVVLGFGYWNFPRAKIFMGDVGSGFLGAVLGIVVLWLSLQQPLYLAISLILMAGFTVDASLTLLVRAAHREPIWQAHRQHAYQHLAMRAGTHVAVTVGLFVVNVCGLLPLAWMAWRGILSPFVALPLAYVPLYGFAWWCGAGFKIAE